LLRCIFLHQHGILSPWVRLVLRQDRSDSTILLLVRDDMSIEVDSRPEISHLKKEQTWFGVCMGSNVSINYCQ
jgi:hypothetical protein